MFACGEGVEPDRQQRLRTLIADIRRRWGEAALRFAPDVRPVAGGAVISTGFPLLDTALGCGVSLGRVTVVCGTPTAGAGTLLLRIIAQAQTEGVIAAIIDLHHTFDPAYAQRCGVDLAELLLVHPSDARESLAICRALFESHTAELVVLDDVDWFSSVSDGPALLEVALTLLRANAEYALKSGRSLAPLIAAYPKSLRATRAIAERCGYTLKFGLRDLPTLPAPPGLTPDTCLAQLCRQGLVRRSVAHDERAEAQLADELRVIAQAGLTNYLLIVRDIVRFCREQGIHCQGRGSAANALVAYLLGISPIDPLAHDLEFGRFLSAEWPTLPDIDLDIQADRRENASLFHRGRKIRSGREKARHSLVVTGGVQ